jgi:hypothetical protein
MDTGLIGSVLNALPLDKMIAAPLMSMIQAQVTSSKAYADFILGVCIEGGKARTIQFDYDETVVDSEGNVAEVRKKTMQIPLLAAISHPNITIEKGTIAFEMTVSQSEESHTSTSGEAGLDAKLGWGPFSVKVHGTVSHKSEQTRKTDTRAKYSINIEAGRQGPPEAMSRVIDFLTDAATKPVQLPSNKGVGKVEDLKGIDSPTNEPKES